MGHCKGSISSFPPRERDWSGSSFSAHPRKSRCAPGFSRGPRSSTSGAGRGGRVSYYHRGDFLSDIGGGISKISSFANFIPGVGSAIGAVGGLLGGGISAIGSLFGGGGPPPLTDAQFAGTFNILHHRVELAEKFRLPMTSPCASIRPMVG